jgi:hydroxyacylglutathione hydrolase
MMRPHFSPDTPCGAVFAVPYSDDNFAWIVTAGEACAVVIDPGEAAPVLERLGRENLTPIAFLCTHSDSDHIAGLPALSARFPAARIAAHPAYARSLPAGKTITPCRDNDVLSLGAIRATCIETPGHTADSMCFLVDCGAGGCALFTGDTLFAMGCGRARAHPQGTFRDACEILFQSQRRIAALPPETLVYPGHNYLEGNLRFAATLPHDAKALQKRRDALFCGQEPPSTIALEKMTNPFLRAIADEDFARDVCAALCTGTADSPNIEAFIALRMRKNDFT